MSGEGGKKTTQVNFWTIRRRKVSLKTGYIDERRLEKAVLKVQLLNTKGGAITCSEKA